MDNAQRHFFTRAPHVIDTDVLVEAINDMTQSERTFYIMRIIERCTDNVHVARFLELLDEHFTNVLS